MCHATDSTPPIAPDCRARARGERLVLVSGDGARFAAFAARPERARAAGLVVLPDVRGLAGFYRDLAVRLAEHGHAAVAIDYYGRTAGIGPRDDDVRFMEHAARLSRATVQADVAAAVSHLRTPAGGGCQAVFTLGFCLGGRISWLAASAGNRLAGAIGIYGAPGIVGPYREPGATQLADRVSAPILALMGGGDAGIPLADVEAFEAALAAAGVEHEIHVYPEAPHGFFDVAHPELADTCADAWRRTLAFIGRHQHPYAGEPARRRPRPATAPDTRPSAEPQPIGRVRGEERS
jgi:carboxymethylenebutenolidase